MEYLTTGLLWFSAIAIGLMAGLYYAFSAFIMRSLDAIEVSAGIRAMQAINRIIVKSSFFPIFFASTLTSIALVVLAATDVSAPGSGFMAGAGALYVLGMFGVTLVGNVPLNNRLERAVDDSPQGAALWAYYLRVWTRWNHVRTLSCVGAFVLLIGALVERS